MIDCTHFQESGRKCGGTCLAKLHGGKPSLGTCRACPHKSKPINEIPKPDRVGKVRMRKKGCSTCEPIIITP